jgi:hypothetical protein
MDRTILAIIFAWMVGGCVTGRIEEPKYEVVARHDDMEVRAYAPRILAETIVEGDFERAPSRGFRVIADFIFGKNKSGNEVAMTAPVEVIPKMDEGQNQKGGANDGEKIAMTAPVTQQQASAANKWTITFTMPASYTMESLPKPVDDRVTIRQLPPMKYVALRFGGFNTRSNVDGAIARLRELAAAQGIKLRGEPVYARYNPPWTPWFWRRNEILIEIAP